MLTLLIVVILIASEAGRSLFRLITSETMFWVIFFNSSLIMVSSCIATGLPKSPASLTLWISGIQPINGTFKSSAKFFAPSLPNM